jgi:hypothetical protein
MSSSWSLAKRTVLDPRGGEPATGKRVQSLGKIRDPADAVHGRRGDPVLSRSNEEERWLR